MPLGCGLVLAGTVRLPPTYTVASPPELKVGFTSEMVKIEMFSFFSVFVGWVRLITPSLGREMFTSVPGRPVILNSAEAGYPPLTSITPPVLMRVPASDAAITTEPSASP